MIVILLLLAALVLLAVILVLTAVVFVRVIRFTEDPQARLPTSVGEYAGSSDPHGTARYGTLSQDSPIDEGFENIMRFQVNGKTGFEQE